MGMPVAPGPAVWTKTALITGYTGQDGTFLTKYLLELGYEVLGLVRRISTEPPRRTRGKFDFSEAIESGQLKLVEGDLLSISSLMKIIGKYQPDEIYNLAAQSHVGQSFTQPEFTVEVDFIGVMNLITALENASDYPWKLYQASTSEMFGSKDIGTVLDEHSPLHPNSPYAIAKTAAHHYCQSMRMRNRYVACGILFNHESEIRGGDFVTQKIVRGVKEWLRNNVPIELGNMDSVRDWGYAGDYVKAMHAMLQQPRGDDYVIATGITHTVREFVEAAFAAVRCEITWSGEGVEEIGTINGSTAVVINPDFYRPNEVGYLYGDNTRAKEALGWEPEVSFDQLVRIMVQNAE